MITMSLTKTQLIGKIYGAFKDVLLEDGIGLWEGLALDDRLQNTREYEALKAKDERHDWQKIPVVNLYECSSSISFLDAKGMRFHMGLYLLFALEVFLAEEDELHEDENFILFPTEVQFALTYNLESEYSKNRFSLLNSAQINCVVHFLEYELDKMRQYGEAYGVQAGQLLHKEHKKLEEAIAFWKVNT